MPQNPEIWSADMENERHGNGMPFAIGGEKRKILLEEIAKGNFLSVACRMAGIRKDVFLDWMCKGGDDRYTRALNPADAVEPYVSFVRDVRRAEAEAESFHTEKIKKGAEKDWRASAWWLEKRHSSRWARSHNRADRQLDGGAAVSGGGQVVIMLPDNGRTAAQIADAENKAEERRRRGIVLDREVDQGVDGEDMDPEEMED